MVLIDLLHLGLTVCENWAGIMSFGVGVYENYNSYLPDSWEYASIFSNSVLIFSLAGFREVRNMGEKETPDNLGKRVKKEFFHGLHNLNAIDDSITDFARGGLVGVCEMYAGFYGAELVKTLIDYVS